MSLYVVFYSLTFGFSRTAKAAFRVIFFRRTGAFRLCLLIVLFASLFCVPVLHGQSTAPAHSAAKVESVWRVQEFMVPMRDGVHLQTVVITRREQTRPLPIFLTRTPYGVPTQEDFDKAAAKSGAEWLPPD